MLIIPWTFEKNFCGGTKSDFRFKFERLKCDNQAWDLPHFEFLYKQKAQNLRMINQITKINFSRER